MISKPFKLNKREFDKRILTTFQHKLRVLMRCYTVKDFKLNELDQTYSFKKTHKMNGVKFEDPSTRFGSYTVEDLPGGKEILLTLILEN